MVFYDTFYQAIQHLKTPEEKLSAYEMLIGYGCEGKEPSQDMSDEIAIIWALAKPLIDATEKRKRDGAKGGRPPKQETAPKGNKFVNFKPSDTDWDSVQRALSK